MLPCSSWIVHEPPINPMSPLLIQSPAQTPQQACHTFMFIGLLLFIGFPWQLHNCG
jgi:hypothetical protein